VTCGAAWARRRLVPAAAGSTLQFLKSCVRLVRMADPSCPVCATADIICGKWTILVIRDLAEGRSRFCELERSLAGISPRTLSLRLRALEEQGIVERHTYPEVPPRVEYSLTLKGEALVPLIEDMRRYGREWLGVSDDECVTTPQSARRERVAA
jgi:DNA-binding HxlR family transcriptional regulator